MGPFSGRGEKRQFGRSLARGAGDAGDRGSRERRGPFPASRARTITGPDRNRDRTRCEGRDTRSVTRPSQSRPRLRHRSRRSQRAPAIRDAPPHPERNARPEERRGERKGGRPRVRPPRGSGVRACYSEGGVPNGVTTRTRFVIVAASGVRVDPREVPASGRESAGTADPTNDHPRCCGGAAKHRRPGTTWSACSRVTWSGYCRPSALSSRSVGNRTTLVSVSLLTAPARD